MHLCNNMYIYSICSIYIYIYIYIYMCTPRMFIIAYTFQHLPRGNNEGHVRKLQGQCIDWR